MEEVKVCQMCLVMDVEMYNILSYPFHLYFEPMYGINPLNVSEIPPFACFECTALAKKFYDFKERCIRGQSTLYGILHENGKITADEIRLIDRKNLKLDSNLTIQKTLECNLIFMEREKTDVDVKHELSDIDGCEAESESVKLENDVPSPLPVTSDDEPLSKHKDNKEKDGIVKKKKFKKKKEKRKKKIKLEIEQLEAVNNKQDLSLLENIEITGVPSESNLEVTDLISSIPRVRKRGRPRKTEKYDDIVEIGKKTRKNDDNETDMEDYVTVIKLSLEEQIAEIQKRVESSNYLNALHQCKLCFKGFIDANAWQHHVRKHEASAGDIECEVCKFRFKSKRALLKHAINHEKKYACKSCSYISKTTTQAKQHQMWHKGVTYKCQYCDEVSSKWTSYLSHVRIKHPSEFICGFCGYSFVSKLGLTMHKTMMHKDLEEKSENEKETGPYCEECKVQFVSVEAWKRHTVTSVKHTQGTTFNNGCRVCGESFGTAEDLRIHHRKEHARKRPKNYGKKREQVDWPTNCKYCSEEIRNARELWNHFRRAHPDKDYPIQRNHVCDICGKSFRGNAFLVYHKRTHFEERAYKCAQCPKAFFNRTNLQMHEKTHSENRPYPCVVCSKAFKCKGALDRHFRSHTGVKPYQCEVCGKSFGQSNSRKLHVLTVHLKQPAPYLSRSRQDKRKPTKHAVDITPNAYLYGGPD